MTKSLLSSLKLSARPEKVKGNPEVKRREKLLTKLDQQLAMANAEINGEAYTCYIEKLMKNEETGIPEKVRIAKNIAKWFYKRGGQYYLEVRFANKPLELSKGNHAIEIGEIENLTATISTVIDAVVAGELDKLLTETSSKLPISKK